MSSITALWDEQEIAGLTARYDLPGAPGDALSKYNPTPGARREGAKAALAWATRRHPLAFTPLGRRWLFTPLPAALSVPGTGRTGFLPVPPNNYPFYSDEEKYVPVMQADGGQLSGRLLRLGWSSVAARLQRVCLPVLLAILHTYIIPRWSCLPVQSGSRCTTPRRSRQRQTGAPLTSGAFPTATSLRGTSMRGCLPSRCAWSASWCERLGKGGEVVV